MIYDNSSDGVYCYSNSNLRLQSDNSGEGQNVIAYNGDNGIKNDNVVPAEIKYKNKSNPKN